jgi:surface polysaccharide O-acyltransferase-like enzyme
VKKRINDKVKELKKAAITYIVLLMIALFISVNVLQAHLHVFYIPLALVFMVYVIRLFFIGKKIKRMNRKKQTITESLIISK